MENIIYFYIVFKLDIFYLVITGMATSVIATYYYLRIIKIMWFEKPIKSRLFFKTFFFTKLIFVLYYYWIFTCRICNLKPLNFWLWKFIECYLYKSFNYLIKSSMSNLNKITQLNLKNSTLKWIVIVGLNLISAIVLTYFLLLVLTYLGLIGELATQGIAIHLTKNRNFFTSNCNYCFKCFSNYPFKSSLCTSLFNS